MVRRSLTGCLLVLPSACWCFQAPVARHPRATLHPRAAVSASAADFSGAWQMDLGASDALGPVLREMQLNRVLAALVSRLSVSQTIRQDADKVCVTVKTRLSTDELELRLDGALTKLPGLSGGLVDAASRWLDDARLETRQHLVADAPGRPDAPDADAFVTVARSHARKNLALSLTLTLTLTRCARCMTVATLCGRRCVSTAVGPPCPARRHGACYGGSRKKWGEKSARVGFEVKVALSPEERVCFFKSKTTYLRETLERAWAVCARGAYYLSLARARAVWHRWGLTLVALCARAPRPRARYLLSLSAAHTPHTTPPRWSLHLLSNENERSADLHRNERLFTPVHSGYDQWQCSPVTDGLASRRTERST